MAKLYPPYIKGTLPAFIKGNRITIPFTLNRAVSKESIKCAVLKLKTVQGTTIFNELNSNENFTNSGGSVGDKVTFTLPENSLIRVGSHYKAQLAFRGKDDVVGYYSTIGVIKCTSQPVVEVIGLSHVDSNSYQYDFTGSYTNNSDPAEKMYSSYMYIYDADGNVVMNSGEQIHSAANDADNYSATETFTFEEELPENNTFFLKYIVTTVNGLVVESPRYKLVQKQGIESDLKAILTAKLNFQEGYITLDLDSTNDLPVSGNFIIERKGEGNWKDMGRFVLNKEVPHRVILRDFTIEQGMNYEYAIQQYNETGLLSKRIISNVIYADFEDAFLYDGKKQLKIRYNPQIATFKKDLLESKTDTIGSKYPFIFRNGVVDYHELSISGLVSFQSDPEFLFMDGEELIPSRKSTPEKFAKDVVDYQKTDEVSANIKKERDFKLLVLEWLNDGKPKLFKSPTEGNYLVRLMNITMSPTDSLGRMLHTFNCNAYEIGEFNYDNMVMFGIIHVDEIDNTVTTFSTINLREIERDPAATGFISLSAPGDLIYSVSFVDMTPGDKVLINGDVFVIGSTGTFQANLPDGVSSIGISANAKEGLVTVSTKVTLPATFGLFDDATIKEVPVRQFIGSPTYGTYWSLNPDDISAADYPHLKEALANKPDNLIDTINDYKTKLIHFYQLHFAARDIIQAFEKDGQYYHDMDAKRPMDMSQLNPLAIYQVCNYRPPEYRFILPETRSGYFVWKNFEMGNYIRPDGEAHPVATQSYFEGFDPSITYDSLSFECEVNDDKFTVDEIETIDLNNFDEEEISNVKFGNGIMCEVGYQAEEKLYRYESEGETKKLKDNYDKLVSDFNSEDPQRGDPNAILAAYGELVLAIKEEVDAYNELNGLTGGTE